MAHWTAEEYREYLRTGKEPRRSVSSTCCQPSRPSGISLDGVPIELLEERPRRRKYGNERVTIDGKTFDSKHEARVYELLMDRVRAGELRCVCRQVRFDLLDGQRLEYVADFVAIGPDMNVEGVYDAKCPATRKDKVYVIKRKLMKEKWGIEVREV